MFQEFFDSAEAAVFTGGTDVGAFLVLYHLTIYYLLEAQILEDW